MQTEEDMGVDISHRFLQWMRVQLQPHRKYWASTSLQAASLLQVFRLHIWLWGRVANVGSMGGVGNAQTSPNGFGVPYISVRNTHYYPRLSYLQEPVNNGACVKLGLGAQTWRVKILHISLVCYNLQLVSFSKFSMATILFKTPTLTHSHRGLYACSTMRIPNLISKISTSHSKDLSTVVTHIVGQLGMSPRDSLAKFASQLVPRNLQKETEKTQNNQQNIVDFFKYHSNESWNYCTI